MMDHVLRSTRRRIGQLTRAGTVDRGAGRIILRTLRGKDADIVAAVHAAVAAFDAGTSDATTLHDALNTACGDGVELPAPAASDGGADVSSAPSAASDGGADVSSAPSAAAAAAAATAAAAAAAAVAAAPDTPGRATDSAVFASIKIEARDDAEDANANFPRNLHNAMELFVATRNLAAARRLSTTTSAMLAIYSVPSDMTNYSMGRACVCWSCGHAGLPENRDDLAEEDTGPAVFRSSPSRVRKPKQAAAGRPAAQCGNCKQSGMTNFLSVLRGKDSVIPWIQLKNSAALEGGPCLAAQMIQKAKAGKK